MFFFRLDVRVKFGIGFVEILVMKMEELKKIFKVILLVKVFKVLLVFKGEDFVVKLKVIGGGSKVIKLCNIVVIVFFVVDF